MNPSDMRSSPNPVGGGLCRRRIDVRGRVQGVGFRPFVYRLARELGLCGVVGNDVHGAFIEIEGHALVIESFIRRLRADLPPLARIAELSVRMLPPSGATNFHIETSEARGLQDAEITPDVATCADCLGELFAPRDRRYRYPFINCTNCGPRYSIILAVPYDRPNTTMARFTMCPNCQAEYDDPASRRFHAQPNACPVCGPRVWMSDRQGGEMVGDAIRLCAEHLRDGRIVAIKGIGGFHLACRADDEAAVGELRLRKSREAKPLAVMVGSIVAAGQLAEIDAAAEAELLRPERPIVLVPCRVGGLLAESVTSGLDRLGLMLPYTPVHHLLFAEGLGPLVMTSGNPAAEPLCCDNGEALTRLGTIADVFLMHDRDIRRRVDDSVVLPMSSGLFQPLPYGRGSECSLPIRRARGFAPEPIVLATEARDPVLAVGGELKSAVCVLAGRQAILSEHLGELDNADAYRHFVSTIEHFKELLQIEPAVIACDMHPAYAATRYARQTGLPVVEVQHHHAHVVSCMAEHGLIGPVIGIACDGTGYGSDGAIWGCEVLIADEASFRRAAHLKYYPLPGGDAGARDTWRPAAGLLATVLGDDFVAASPAFERIDAEAIATVGHILRHPRRVPRSSSLGRLFDAVAFLLGICSRNRYEAEAAMLLEAIARTGGVADPLPVTVADAETAGAAEQFDMTPALRELIRRRQAGEPVAVLARAFHETIATMLGEAAVRAAEQNSLNRVVLSGGCMANQLLSRRIEELLIARGLAVYTHHRVPAGDGGIALGQAVVAAAADLRYRAARRSASV